MYKKKKTLHQYPIMDRPPKMSITVRTSNGVEQDVTKYMENSCQPIGFGPDGQLMFSGPYEVDGEDGFVPDLTDEGRDSSSKSSKKRDLFNEDHLIKVYVLSPFLFGKTFQPDSWIKYLYEVGLLATSNPICEDSLSMKQLDVVEVIERIHEVVLADSKENTSRKKQMKELFESIDKSVFDRDRGHLKVKPLTEILDRSRKFTFLESWQRTVKEKKDGDNGLVLDDRAMFVAVIFTCRQFVEHWHRSNKGESLVDKFKAEAKKKYKKIHKVKEKGNDFFKAGAFEKASDFYSKAIRESPFNAILYGNRAQSCLSCDRFDGALTDGKRAIMLDPGWHKGYLRFAEAYFRLNLKDKAFSVIELGLSFCPGDRNLLDHREKFRDPGKYNNNRMSAPNNEDQTSKPSNTAETDSSDGLDGSLTDNSESDGDMPDLVSDSEEEDSDADPPDLVTGSENSEPEEDATVSEKQDIIVPEKKMPSLVLKTTKKEKKDKKSKKTEKKHSQPWRRNTQRTDSEPNQESQEKNLALKKMQEKDDRHTEVFKLWKQGSESLLDHMFPNAIFFYNKCLDMINIYNIENITRLVELDVVLLKFSLGISCVEMGSSKEINEGLRLFNEILSDHTTVKFPLAFHGLGRAWLRQFRFVECLEIVERGLEVVLNMTQQITYTWPGTTVVIKESLSGALQESLEQMVVRCHNPPVPEAVCRYHKCHGYYSIKIYIADPDFKGLVRIHCFAQCTVEYHVECWRRFKKERLSQSDKDYLNSGCLTPDCDARISKIHSYDQLGATIKEIITPVIGKTEIPQKKAPCDKMMLSSVTTIAKREAKKQLRKQRKKEVRELKLRQKEVGNVAEGEGLVVMSETQQQQQQINKVSETAGEEDMGAAGIMERLAEAHVYQKLEEAGEVCGQIGMQKYMTVLNKKEEEEEEGKKAMDAKASTKVRSKKKQKSKVTMTLDEFVGPRETPEDGNTPVYMDCMDEFTAESGSLDLGNPFARPNKGAIKQELDMFDGLCTETSSLASSGSHSDNKHSEIKEALFSFFVGILSEYGPLDKDDVVIKRELEDFPLEAHEVIDSAGGIDKLLLQSLQFAVVDNFVCLLPDTVKAKKLADLHKNPLKRSDSQIYASVTKAASRLDFPSLGQASARIPADAYIRGSKLDELDVFTTTAGNLDSPITSPTGIDSSAQSSWTINGDSNGTHQITNLSFTSSSAVNSATVTVSKSCLGTIVTAVESPSSKKGPRDSLQKDESVGQKSKMTTESNKSSKDKFDIPSKDNSSAKPNSGKPGKGKKDPEAEVTVASEKKIDVSSSGSQKTSRPIKSVTPPTSSDKIDDKSSKTKMDTAKPAVGKAKGTTKAAAASPVTAEVALPLKNKNGIETSVENFGKTMPERQSNIKESFKNQVHAAAAVKKTGVADVKAKKEEVQAKVETVKKTTTELAKKVTKKETQPKLQVAKGKSVMGGQKGKTTETTKEENVKIQASVESKGVKDKGHLTLGKFTEIKETVKSESNGFSESSSATPQYEQPFVQGTILRSCDDVSPVGSEPFRFPTQHESGTSSQSSSMHSLYDPQSLNACKVREPWEDGFSVSDPKFQESGGPWKSKLQEWKTHTEEEGYEQLDKINNDSQFITESRTSDKDPSPAKYIDSMGSSSPPPKLSKPPGFGGKAYSNPAALDISTNGASKYGPIGSKSRTDSPASGSSKESSHASTPIHGIQMDMVDSQLPPFPSVHTGESFVTGQSIGTRSLAIEAPYHNGLFINNAVWGSVPPQPPSSFNSTLPPPPPHMAQMGYTNANSPDRSVQSTLQQSDEQFINENTNSVYNSLRENEAFKYNPTLKQDIEADIRADIERSNAPHPSAHKETLTKVRAPVGSKPVKPAVKMRNAASQCTPVKDSVRSVACNTEPYEPYKAEYLKGQVELEVTHTRLHELLDKHTQLQNSSNAELKNLRSRVDALELECKGLRKERSKAVEDRDAENKKWSNEKKLVAEEVKNIKREMKNMKVREENALRQVQEKDSQIATLSSQLNIERETIVSEREKFQSDREELHRLHSMQLSRAENAEVKLLQLKVEVGSQILERSLKDAEMYAKQSQQIIQNMKEGKKPVPPQLLAAGEQWETTVKRIKDIKLQSMTQFEEQIRQINQGTPLSALQQLPIPRPPRAPENPMAVMNAFVRNNPGGFPGRGTSNVLPSGAIPTNRPPNVRMPTNQVNQKSVPQGGSAFTGPPPLNTGGNMQRANNPIASQHKSKSAFDKIMDKLTTLFPNLVRSNITNYIQDLRSSRSGSLSGMSLDDIVRRVAEMILKDNARKPTKPASISQGPPAMASASSSYPSMARMSPNPDRGSGSTQADEIFEEEEDPCIICHDELNAAPTEHLKCCHRFHRECIKKWFKEQSTCPTCRVHALLPDDYPSLG